MPCVEVQEIEDICTYEKDNFNLECFGDCGRSEPFDEGPVDMADLWEECTDEAVEFDCNRYEFIVNCPSEYMINIGI